MASSSIPADLLTSFATVSVQGQKYDSDISPSDQYYGFLVEIEDAAPSKSGLDLFSVQFEIAPLEWVEAAVLSLPDDVKAPPPPAPASQLVFDDAPLDDVAAALGTTAAQMAEGDWYIITLGRGVGAKVAPITTGTSRFSVVKAGGLPAGKGLGVRLRRKYAPRSRFSVRIAKKLLGVILPREVGVMDVGQASCNLVYDGAGTPQVYIDVGLPMYFNFPSLPPPSAVTGFVQVINPGPCLGNNPPGVITHFHWDHYWMLVQSVNFAALRNRDWIFPPQAAGFVVNLIIAGINAQANGHVHVFPAGMAALPAGFINIIQCVPGAGVPAADLNNTGLAVVVRANAALALETLLPGDAAFQSIPGVAAMAGLRWMTATHHGSDRHLVPPPPPLLAPPIPPPNVANQGRLAYSYGINGPFPANHCYGHPRAAAVAAYPVAGWGIGANVASTAETGPNSNVAGRGNTLMASNVIPPACGVANCPFHVFPKILV